MADLSPVVICLSRSGEATARRVAEALGAAVHGREGRVEGADASFANTLEHIRTLFAARTPIIGVCAAGILIRAVASLLADKRSEPPVIAVAEDGSAVAPLLGGHHGANRLARRIAGALGGHAAVTTAGDVALGVALDEPPPGWRLANPEDAKAVMAALLSFSDARLQGECDWLESMLAQRRETAERMSVSGFNDGHWIIGPSDPRPLPTAALRVPGKPPLRYYHTDLVLGLGCARGAAPEEMWALVTDTLAAAELAPEAIAMIGTIALKADEPAIMETARRLGVPLRLFDAATLEAEGPRLANPSEVVFAEVGCHGVAEGAALAGAGPEATLLVDKQKSANATVALARAPAPITELRGRPRGRLALVGIGPGQADWRTPEASRLIAEADELAGYGLYIDLIGPQAHGKPRRDFPLGAEEERCRYALEHAGEGHNIALICSGDAGIYAMGALVFELLDRAPDQGGVSAAARRVEVISAPGVSALQAAAARAGAPLGHDFCAISLSDLLTPREDIIRRIRAAAEGDFVIAFYNPVSARRRTLLAEASEILLAHRPADTPVLLAANLGRPEEKLVYRRLADLAVDEVDMLTVVLVGSSQSKLAQLGDGPRMYTPRGYASKMEAIG